MSIEDSDIEELQKRAMQSAQKIDDSIKKSNTRLFFKGMFKDKTIEDILNRIEFLNLDVGELSFRELYTLFRAHESPINMDYKMTIDEMRENIKK